MSVPAESTYFPEPRPAVLVVSHERSGTHFLMNSLATCHGYVSLPWINFDLADDNILNHLTKSQVRDQLLTLADRPLANVVKSHHPVDFFAEELGRLTERFVIFAIHRHPVDVMISFWRFMYNFLAEEGHGPQTSDPVAFARAAPAGRVLRYQTRPYATMLHRWAAHVDGWREAAAANPRVRSIAYEDLASRFEETVAGFEPLLGRAPRAIVRPPQGSAVIKSGPADPTGSGKPPDRDALSSLCRETVGETMQRMGYH